MRQILLPWLPPVLLPLLVVAYIALARYTPVIHLDGLFEFFYTIPFHVIAVAVYLKLFLLIRKGLPGDSGRLLFAQLSFVVSLLVWTLLIALLTADLQI